MISIFGFAAAAALLSANGSFGDSADADGRAVEQCAFDSLARVVGGGSQWHDLSSAVLTDPGLAAELSDMMPGYRLAYINTANMGLLLLGGDRLAADAHAEGRTEDYWREAESATRAACQASGVECEVTALSDAPFGLAAMTRIDQEGETYRRETLAFPGDNACTYSLQFTGSEQAITDSEWRVVRDGLQALRGLVTGRKWSSR